MKSFAGEASACYCKADLVIAISVGSEDLYRVSEPGLRNKAGVGQNAETIVGFIKDEKTRLANTPLKGTPFTHVDTWTARVNGSNKDVIDEIDFLAVNACQFYESELDNKIGNAGPLLSDALAATDGVAGGKVHSRQRTEIPARPIYEHHKGVTQP